MYASGISLFAIPAVCVQRVLINVLVPAAQIAQIEDFITLFRELPGVDAGLAASIFHFGEDSIPALKALLKENDILVRL